MSSSSTLEVYPAVFVQTPGMAPVVPIWQLVTMFVVTLLGTHHPLRHRRLQLLSALETELGRLHRTRRALFLTVTPFIWCPRVILVPALQAATVSRWQI
jgi:hypothetical protein